MQHDVTHGPSIAGSAIGRTGEGPMASQRRRVLVVDDEPLIGTTLRILLDEHDVKVVTSGRAARELIAGGAEFDVVLCDLMLDDVSGMELARWIEETNPAMAERMVFMTGGAFTDDARRFLHGIPSARQLEKPFSSDEIQRILRSVR